MKKDEGYHEAESPEENGYRIIKLRNAYVLFVSTLNCNFYVLRKLNLNILFKIGKMITLFKNKEWEKSAKSQSPASQISGSYATAAWFERGPRTPVPCAKGQKFFPTPCQKAKPEPHPR